MLFFSHCPNNNIHNFCFAFICYVCFVGIFVERWVMSFSSANPEKNIQTILKLCGISFGMKNKQTGNWFGCAWGKDNLTSGCCWHTLQMAIDDATHTHTQEPIQLHNLQNVFRRCFSHLLCVWLFFFPSVGYDEIWFLISCIYKICRICCNICYCHT